MCGWVEGRAVVVIRDCDSVGLEIVELLRC